MEADEIVKRSVEALQGRLRSDGVPEAEMVIVACEEYVRVEDALPGDDFFENDDYCVSAAVATLTKDHEARRELEATVEAVSLALGWAATQPRSTLVAQIEALSRDLKRAWADRATKGEIARPDLRGGSLCGDCNGSGFLSLEASAIDRTVSLMSMRCSTCCGRGVIDRPSWQQQLDELADNYGAKPHVLARALTFGRVLVRLGIVGSGHLDVQPVPGGSVRFKWSHDGVHAEIEIGPREDQR